MKIPSFLIADFKSNHAGETGAVFIYKAARIFAISSKTRNIANSHLLTEQEHLKIINNLINKSNISKLIFLWKIFGFLLGFIGSIFGHKFFCLTIYAVESFVKDHYQQQIDKLSNKKQYQDLRNLIIKIQSEEIEHMEDGINNGYKKNLFSNIWIKIIYQGSKSAVNIAKKI
jgi:3-demethoxyubiquinol 3-hydroxylase